MLNKITRGAGGQFNRKTSRPPRRRGQARPSGVPGGVLSNSQASLRATFLALTTYNYLADMKMHKPVNPTSLLLLALLLIAACWQNSAAQNPPPPQDQSQQSQNQASGQKQSPPATDKMPPGMNMPMDMPGMDPGMPGMNTGGAVSLPTTTPKPALCAPCNRATIWMARTCA